MRKTSLVAVALLCANTAHAAQWSVDAKTSTLTFEGTQSGEKFTGQFKTFTPTIDFDPHKPEQGKIDVVIDLASADTNDKDRMEALPTDDWFAVKKFPHAQFHATKITRAARTASIGPAFDVEGTLTLRGITKPVTLSFDIDERPNQPRPNVTHVIGGATLNRHDFGVGQGQWEKDEWIKFPVQVHFEIYATEK